MELSGVKLSLTATPASLTPQQKLAADLLCAGKTIEETAKLSGVSVSTINGWKNDALFKERMEFIAIGDGKLTETARQDAQQIVEKVGAEMLRRASSPEIEDWTNKELIEARKAFVGSTQIETPIKHELEVNLGATFEEAQKRAAKMRAARGVARHENTEDVIETIDGECSNADGS